VCATATAAEAVALEDYPGIDPICHANCTPGAGATPTKAVKRRPDIQQAWQARLPTERGPRERESADSRFSFSKERAACLYWPGSGLLAVSVVAVITAVTFIYFIKELTFE
jgi:hypothetical protein